MKRDWKEYNKQLVKRGEIIIDEDIFLSENTLPITFTFQKILFKSLLHKLKSNIKK